MNNEPLFSTNLCTKVELWMPALEGWAEQMTITEKHLNMIEGQCPFVRGKLQLGFAN